jgi:hypothetical protein
LIPIRKNSNWWALSRDERRPVFKAQSHHAQIGLEYLPAIARRLRHCRDLAEPEPCDFLNRFAFANQDTAESDRLLVKPRSELLGCLVAAESNVQLTPRSVERKTPVPTAPAANNVVPLL